MIRVSISGQMSRMHADLWCLGHMIGHPDINQPAQVYHTSRQYLQKKVIDHHHRVPAMYRIYRIFRRAVGPRGPPPSESLRWHAPSESSRPSLQAKATKASEPAASRITGRASLRCHKLPQVHMLRLEATFEAQATKASEPAVSMRAGPTSGQRASDVEAEAT